MFAADKVQSKVAKAVDANGWFRALPNGGSTMLQANHSNSIQMTVFNPLIPRDESMSTRPPVAAPNPLTEQLLELFEVITGWKAEFAESRSSQQRRKVSTSQTEPVAGTISIVDMSELWPAQKPTCHRGKCDQLIAVINQMVGDLQVAQLDMAKLQSALVALDPNEDIDDDDLVDSFIPKFQPKSNFSAERLDTEDRRTISDFDTDFELAQDVFDSPIAPVSPPFEGWEFGGSTGIVENFYLDWMVDSEERISICAGEIDTVTGDDHELMISIDPLTKEFQSVPPQTQGRGNLQQAFYLWDSSTLTLVPILPDSNWYALSTGQAIVSTMSEHLEDIGCVQEALASTESTEGFSASEIANALKRVVGGSSPLLVLKQV